MFSAPKTNRSATNMWENLELIRSVLELEEREFAEILKVSDKEYSRLKKQKHSLSVDSALAVAERLNVGFDSIITGSIDFRAMKAQFQGDTAFVPERYSRGAKSKVRSAGTFLKYIETTYGSVKKDLVLRKHQFKEEALSDLDAFVSVRFASDLCKYVYKFSGSLEEVMNMGRYSAVTYANTAFGRDIRSTHDPRAAYAYVFGEVVEKYIEQNFWWRVEEVTREGCRVIGTPNISPEECFKTHDPLMCYLRAGFISSVSAFLGMPISHIVKTKCIWNGDPHCEVRVTFPSRTQEQTLPLKLKQPSL